MTTATNDAKFRTALYTQAEAAQYLDVRASTMSTWAKGYRRVESSGRSRAALPIITSLARVGRGPTIPFVGLAEGLTVSAFRRAGLPMQRIRPAVDALRANLGLEHALASNRLYTDGVEVIYDFGEATGDEYVRDLVVVRDNQRMFNEIVQGYLKRIDFGDDGYAALIRLPAYRRATVIADPSRGFGQPIFASGGAKLEDVLGAFQAGQSLQSLVREYGVGRADLEDAVRVATLAA